MTASGKKLGAEEKAPHPADQMIDIMLSPDRFWNMPQSIAGIITGYAWDNPLEGPTLFAGFDNTLNKILFLAEYAGPLDRFEYLVTKLIEKEKLVNDARKPNEAEHYTLIDRIFTLRDSQGTLMQHLVIRLDLTIRRKNGPVVDDGLADCFAEIVKELLPHRYEDILKQASIAAPVDEDPATKAKRELVNSIKLNKIFNMFTQDDKHIQQAVTGCDLSLILLHSEDSETMNELLSTAANDYTPVLVSVKDKFIIGGDPEGNGKWKWTPINIESLTPDQLILLNQLPFEQGIIRRNHYQFKPLIHFLKTGHDLIETLKDFVETDKMRSTNDQGFIVNNLSNLNRQHLISEAFGLLFQRGNELPGGWHGRNADRFCIELIAKELQIDLPPRTKQLLNNKENGLYKLFFNENKRIARYIDVNSSNYRKVGSEGILGVNAYYSVFRPNRAGNVGFANRFQLADHLEWDKNVFNYYYEQLNQSSKFIQSPHPVRAASRHCALM